jgi:hypothetical protein
VAPAMTPKKRNRVRERWAQRGFSPAQPPATLTIGQSPPPGLSFTRLVKRGSQRLHNPTRVRPLRTIRREMDDAR